MELKVPTTEDSIRYTFFAALIASGEIEPHEVLLEVPHPKIRRAKIDTVLPSLSGRPIAIEFKYDREIPSSSAVPKPQNAGELFKDFSRLALYTTNPEPERLLVYCTDHVMVKYFQNIVNGHTAFFSLALRERLMVDDAYIASKPAAFQKALGTELLVELECVWSESLPNHHELRIYNVLPITVASDII